MLVINLKKIIVKKPKILNLFRLGRGWAPFPLFYLVHLTLACNARCQFCYQNGPVRESIGQQFLNKDDFEIILKQAKSFLFRWPRIHFFGGEPTLHPQFGELVGLAGKYHFPCSLTTNGILLGNYQNEISAADNLSQINISLYGLAEVHDRIVGLPGAFERVISGLRSITRGGAKKKIININCVINKENFGQLARFADFLSKSFQKEIDSLIFQYPMQKEICKEIDGSIFRSEAEQIKKTRANFEIYFTSDSWFNNRRASNQNYLKGDCNVPWLGLSILPNLDVVAGAGALACFRNLGNLKEKNIKEIWNGKELGNFRRKILKQGLPSACWGCCHGQCKNQ